MKTQIKIETEKKTFIRSPYNYDRKAVSIQTGLECRDKSLAVQSQKEEADINEIVRRFGIDGKMPLTMRIPKYGDFSQVEDYQTCLEAIQAAKDEFMKLPARLRAEFGHNPQELLEFMDGATEEEIKKMGLSAYKKMTDDETPRSPGGEKSESLEKPKYEGNPPIKEGEKKP